MDQKLEGLFRKLELAIKHDAEATAIFQDLRKEVIDLSTFSKYHLDMSEIHRKKAERQQEKTDAVHVAVAHASNSLLLLHEAVNNFGEMIQEEYAALVEKDASHKG